MSLNNEFEIQNIKKLDLIYFYDISNPNQENPSSPFLGLKIVYDGNKGLGYDVTSPYFNQFVKRVKQVYEEEKQKRNIEFLNDFSKKTLDEIENNHSSKINEKLYENKSLLNIRTRYSEIMEIDDYLKEICKNILSFLLPNNNISIEKIKGHDNRFCVLYIVNDLEIKTLPLIVKKVSYNEYDFIINFVSDYVFPAEGKIKFEDGYVNVKWKSVPNEIKGVYNYNINSDFNENSVRKKDKLLKFEEIKTDVDEQVKILLNFYLKEFLDKTSDICVPTVSDNFLLSKTEFLDSDSNTNLYKQFFCHANIKKDFVRLKYHEINGFSKKNDSLLIPLDDLKQEIFIKLFVKDNKKYIISETNNILNYRDSEILNYQKKQYFYSVFEVDNFKDFNSKFDIKTKQDINDEDSKQLLLKLIK